MRFGLVGTGSWARDTHAAALQAAPGAQLVGVWGRDVAKARALAEHLGTAAGAAAPVHPFAEVDDLFDAVEAVVLSVPPEVQAPLAERAARRGLHLLLEKPVATSVEAARSLEAAVLEAAVASVVFFTARYTDEVRSWLAEAAGADWDGATARWLGNAFGEGSPFDTPWRREKGGLWDVGPHALSMLTAALGPVREVQATAGVRDVVQLVLSHEGGATSTATLSISASAAASGVALELWGAQGRTSMPTGPTTAPVAAVRAVQDLVAAASGAGAPSHPCDVTFGRYVVELLVEAQRQLDARPA